MVDKKKERAMIFGKRTRVAMITVELAVSLALIVVVLFVALGLFGDNLKSVVENSNFKNVFNKDDSKFFSNYGKDYASSQIVVQVMGEQGLKQLRRKANNKAIDLIENPFDSNNNKNAVGIAYLSTVIKGIVGNGDICVYMMKDSNALCSDPEIGGYKYRISLSSSAIKITRIPEAATDRPYQGYESINLLLDSEVSSTLLSAFNESSGISSGGTTPDSTAMKYEKINALTQLLESKIGNNASLVRLLNTFKSQRKIKLTVEAKKILKDIFLTVGNRIEKSYRKCYCVQGMSGHYYCGHIRKCSQEGKAVQKDDKNSVDNHLDNLYAISERYSDANALLEAVIKESCTESGRQYLDLLTNDNLYHTYQYYVDSINDFAADNNVQLNPEWTKCTDAPIIIHPNVVDTTTGTTSDNPDEPIQ